MSEQEDDLAHLYPDLSDEDSNEEQEQANPPGSQPHKIIKPNEG